MLASYHADVSVAMRNASPSRLTHQAAEGGERARRDVIRALRLWHPFCGAVVALAACAHPSRPADPGVRALRLRWFAARRRSR